MFVKSMSDQPITFNQASSRLAESKPLNAHYKYWTFSVKTLNFLVRINNVFSPTVHP